MTQPRWLELAWADLGVAETPGPDHNARVVTYYADAGHPQVEDDETAWCAAFLGACLERAGIAGTRSLKARSYLGWGEPLGEFRFGAIAVLSRTADPALGHVGFLVGSTAGSVMLLGGNQSNAVTVEAFPRARLLGLRWPSAVISEAEGKRPEAIRDPAASDALFERALAHVLKMEGGWADDPYDPGGPTNFGITLATYARDRGLELAADNFAQLKADLRTIPQSKVRRIYFERYWLPASCPELPAPLALFHFDTAVNQGVAGAARMLQEAVGAAIDGEVGPETLAKAAAQPAAVTLKLYAGMRRRHYRSLSAFWRFGRGWLARVERTLAATNGLAAPAAPAGSLQQQETDPMTNSTEPTAEMPPADSKWWGHSMTIWGVVITTLSTVLPTLGPLIGLDLTPELVRQLGDQVLLAVQALGGLAGTILTIYGRVRATTPLDRRQVTLKM